MLTHTRQSRFGLLRCLHPARRSDKLITNFSVQIWSWQTLTTQKGGNQP